MTEEVVKCAREEYGSVRRIEGIKRARAMTCNSRATPVFRIVCSSSLILLDPAPRSQSPPLLSEGGMAVSPTRERSQFRIAQPLRASNGDGVPLFGCRVCFC